MRKKYRLVLLSIMIVVVTGGIFWINRAQVNTNGKKVTKVENNKTLIVYYSRTGNTKEVAKLIQAQVGGELVPIETLDDRPANYAQEVKQNEQEQEKSLLPKLKTQISDFDSYNRIFIGAPTWNMALPQAVVTFLDQYNFSGKTVIPFNTNGGYGEGDTFSQIKKGTKGAKVLGGISLKGGEETNGILLAIKGDKKVEVSKEIDKWLKKIRQK